eukprot:CAMPEP_0185403686 /NCGR_PEP_ID=MMETSP1364-20130426/92419_1 /TAXON_ID=38817 /ORGANISM="Gephyrocapsa oceanica, Strain RCC1303" /LENGTH=602 /DNA_ID=CAMNT_0028005985 /DNA_START=81 /DNA_END=1887 /DNA_ORIENTATION=+
MYGKRKPEHLHTLRFHRFETEDDVEEVDRQMIADGLAQARSVSARGNAAATMYNKFVDEQSRGLVDLVGTFLLRAMKDPDAPAAVHRIVEKQWSLVWPGVRDQLYWDLAASMQLLDEEAAFFRSLRLRHWKAQHPPLWPARRRCPTPLTALRARLRYAVFPADSHQADVAIAAWLGANLISWGEICNWASLLHFLFTDRTDEYQLVNYIIFSKICHFAAFGLIPGVQALLAYFDCTMLDVGDAHPCHETTTQSPVSATFELLRVALAAFAFLLLRTSSSGGDAHVARLELARLGLAQAATPSGRGQTLRSRRRALGCHTATIFTVSHTRCSECAAHSIVLPPTELRVSHAPGSHSATGISKIAAGPDGSAPLPGGGAAPSCGSHSATGISKIAAGPDGSAPLPARRGGAVLCGVVLLDAVAFALCFGVGFNHFCRRRRDVDCAQVDCSIFYDWEEGSSLQRWPHEVAARWLQAHGLGHLVRGWLYDQRFWAYMDFAQTCYSLMLFPYVLLGLPPCKAFLTHARRTGYDKAGRLCWALSNQQMLERSSMLHSFVVQDRAATRMQAFSRGAAARGAAGTPSSASRTSPARRAQERGSTERGWRG